MRPLTLGNHSISRVAEIEIPAFPALEFLPAATPDMLDEAASVLPGRLSADGRIWNSCPTWGLSICMKIICSPGMNSMLYRIK